MRGTKTELVPGKWRLRVYVGRSPKTGSPIQVQRVFRGGVRAADVELARMVTKAGSGRLTPTSATVGQLINAYIDHVVSIGRAETTTNEYRRIAEKKIDPAIGKVRLSKLTARHLDRFYAELIAKGNKPATVRRVHALISAALHQGEKWGDVESSVARKATPPRCHASEVTAPSVEQVQDLITTAEDRDPMLATMVTLAALTGARLGELCGLVWSDWDEKGATLRIGHSVYKTADGAVVVKETKTHQVRTIGLDPVAQEALRRHRSAVQVLARKLGQKAPDDSFVLSESPVGSEPVLPRLISQRARRLGKDAGVPGFHFHQLRHYAATRSIAGGFDAVTVANRLGHADPSITLKVYSHALESRDRDMAAALGSELALTAAPTS